MKLKKKKHSTKGRWRTSAEYIMFNDKKDEPTLS